MIDGILIGLATALTLQNILMVMIGCFFGTIIGMLPGLGPMTAIALMIPITYGFDPATGLILMAGVYYGAVFGGSTSSILLNAPGVPGTVATSFDGYPMAQQGKAGKALAIAAWSSLQVEHYLQSICYSWHQVYQKLVYLLDHQIILH